MAFRGYHDIAKQFGFRKWSMSVRPFSLQFRSKWRILEFFADVCTARKEECPQILFHKLVVW